MATVESPERKFKARVVKISRDYSGNYHLGLPRTPEAGDLIPPMCGVWEDVTGLRLQPGQYVNLKLNIELRSRVKSTPPETPVREDFCPPPRRIRTGESQLRRSQREVFLQGGLPQHTVAMEQVDNLVVVHQTRTREWVEVYESLSDSGKRELESRMEQLMHTISREEQEMRAVRRRDRLRYDPDFRWADPRAIYGNPGS